jgi:hypothetical protein
VGRRLLGSKSSSSTRSSLYHTGLGMRTEDRNQGNTRFPSCLFFLPFRLLASSGLDLKMSRGIRPRGKLEVGRSRPIYYVDEIMSLCTRSTTRRLCTRPCLFSIFHNPHACSPTLNLSFRYRILLNSSFLFRLRPRPHWHIKLIYHQDELLGASYSDSPNSGLAMDAEWK